MKGTSKGDEPEVLTEWWAANQAEPPPPWDLLQNPQKRAVLTALLDEQKHVCVYCGRAISIEPGVAHIEHFWPRSIFANRRFDWTNLYASCGPSGKKNTPKICGDAKDSWSPSGHIDPTDPHCEPKFAYDGNGAISGTAIGGEPAVTMIQKLNLADATLNYERFLIVGYLEERIAAGEIDASTKPAEIALWRSTSSDGKLKSFSHVAVRYLEDQAL